jgi:gluconokinase
MDTPDLVVGVDIGTTATKAVAFTVDGTAHGTGEGGYPLDEPEPGAAVQDPEAIWEAVGDAVRDAVAAVDPARVAAVSFSSAMHGLLALDADGNPLGTLMTWADHRAAATADALRSRDGALALHRRTGTPIHPMSPLVKLAWLRAARPSLHSAAHMWGGMKELVLHRATGEWATDTSCASGTGLLDLATGRWDDEALELAGLTTGSLPPLVAPTDVVGALRETGWGLPGGVPVVAGGGDGPLANLGVGAVRPGVAACSIGTSGALRVTVDRPAVDARGRVFCYGLTDARWVVGGATTNGGLVLDWARELLRPDGDVDELLDLAADVPAAAVLALPHLLGERAPRWDGAGAGALLGLRRHHGAGHVVRALLEGVCLQLRLVLDAMRDAGIAVDEVRATGGFARSPLWRAILTDVLDLPVAFPALDQGSAFGAALLGAQGVGLLDPGPDALVAATDHIPIDETRHPGDDAAVYGARLPLFERAYDVLRDLGDEF